ncbi:unnamed protein product [Rotaria magnacalcarata]|nr:unnamed protein product [Rotaria magnacalcarata]CAF1407757.1 unnamed protein product [Rotaria magnacalcarata]CAF2073225.1 unnamed protein product [Rotaria magnacalcarata]
MNDTSEQPDFIECLKIIVNLSKLKHLDISKYQRIITSEKLLELLQESPQLSSMKIDLIDLTLLYDNEELCEYLTKIIRCLNIYKYAHCSFNDVNEMDKFYRIFENILHLTCNINDANPICFLLNRFRRLSIMRIHMSSSYHFKCLSTFLREQSVKLNLILHVKYLSLDASEVSI